MCRSVPPPRGRPADDGARVLAARRLAVALPSMTLRIFISVDMEGIGGITTVRQVTRGTDDYSWARLLMTQEANAAVQGAVDAGALKIVVSDSHGDMGNILPLELDPRAELVQGTPKLPWSMMTGIEDGMTGCVFLGYHAASGTARAILDHTYTGWFADIRVNGLSWNETHLNAALAGTFNVPVLFVSGDEECCNQATAALPWIKAFATKTGFAATSGRSKSPKTCQDAIRRLVADSVKQVERAEVWKPEGPFVLEALLTTSGLADMLSIAPGTERTSPRSVSFQTPDVRTMYRMLLTWMNLGRRVGPTSPVE
jgi:D-amino peptidase